MRYPAGEMRIVGRIAAALVPVFLAASLGAWAQPYPPTAVVILPFTTADEELAIYGKPVANAVAKALGGRPALRARAATEDGARTPGGDLIVELRANRERKRIRLEATVRDPELGDTLAAASTRPVKLGQIDEATADLARRLGPMLESAATARRRRKAEEFASAAAAGWGAAGPVTAGVGSRVGVVGTGGSVASGPVTGAPAAGKPIPEEPIAGGHAAGFARGPGAGGHVAGGPMAGSPGTGGRASVPGTGSGAGSRVAGAVSAPDRRPVVVVYEPEGEVAGGAVEVRGIARAALCRLLEDLGYRVEASGNFGLVPVAVASRDAKDSGAKATLMLRVVGVEFAWKGVLSARGRVRLIAVSPSGRVLFDRTVRTDTVVGSRGDRHDALVRFVLRQAMDMVARELRVALR